MSSDARSSDGCTGFEGFCTLVHMPELETSVLLQAAADLGGAFPKTQVLDFYPEDSSLVPSHSFGIKQTPPDQSDLGARSGSMG